MIKLSFDFPPPPVRHVDGRQEIFCIIRKKWFVFTPEEWVRQNILEYLVRTMHYPASLIAVEKQLVLGELKKRFDIVVYSNAIDPFMIIECKEMEVPLSEKTLMQVLRYNMPMQAPVIVLTNGAHCVAYKIKDGQVTELDELPAIK